jgi:GNAT superfamily N-acetyltransferase
VARARADEAPGADLITAEMDELTERYGAADEYDGLVPEQMAAPGGMFLLAWLDGRAVGCGGVRCRDDMGAGVGELKRMYVAPDARRRRVGRALLDALEGEASRLGYSRLVLETGTKQPDAIALYTSAGYEPIAPYGTYRDSPDSRCFAKPLAR